MLVLELFENTEPVLIQALRDFLPIAVKTLKLDHVPKIHLVKALSDTHVPTFGRFENESRKVSVVVDNRNPVDIIRTLAHELVHYAQDERGELDADSWQTGSPEENQAHELAGVMMREFDSKYPKYLSAEPVMLPEAWSQKYKRSINCNNPKGFSQRAHCQGRKKHNESADYDRDMQSDPSNPIPFPKGTTLVNVSDVYDWYKLGMAVPALDKADPRIFNKGVPHTVFAFGSEEEEHRMMPLLKRLGFTLHDIDRPEDYEKAIRASDVVEYLEEYVAENLVEAEQGCPPATQDISLNLKNRQKAIDEYHYGPLNPNLPNNEYWQELADKWNTSDIQSVKQNRCGNCGAFDVSKKMQACIAKGIGSEPGSNAMDSVDAGDLGYCKFLKFKCASKRTCDAWIEGGPITEGKRCDAKGAVPELKAALDNRKKELNKLSDKQVYAKIDKIMTRIANTYDLTGQELHDMWTERYGEIPDTYIIETLTSNVTSTTPLENLPPIVKGLIYKWELMDWGTTDPDLAHDRAGHIHERDLASKKLAQLGFAISKSRIGVLLTHLRTRQSIDIDGEDIRDWEKFIRTADLSLGLAENFADGKKPGRKGLAKRSGVNCKQSVSKLRSIAKNSSGERQRMAHWCANMKAGRAK